jgi:perosamine synthetase
MLASMIRLARPTLGEEEAKAAREVLATGMLVQGERVARFEAELAKQCRRAHAVAVSSGTSALELALMALRIGPGDEVLVPALTWPSPAHAVRLRGATPVLVDVDPAEWNATAEAFAKARTERTRAAIAIDQFGAPARHGAIAEALNGLPVIEDAACAIGSVIDGRPAGSFGIVACFSFHPRKVITTGEGGAVVTDDPILAERLRVLRNHGQAEPGSFVEAAGNHRMTEVAAAIGLCQLARLPKMLAHRQKLGDVYRAELADLPLTPQRWAEGARGNEQTFGVILHPTAVPPRDVVIDKLRARRVQAGILSYALHRLPSVGPQPDDAFPAASALADRGLALPMHAELDDDDLDVVVAAIRSILSPR